MCFLWVRPELINSLSGCMSTRTIMYYQYWGRLARCFWHGFVRTFLIYADVKVCWQYKLYGTVDHDVGKAQSNQSSQWLGPLVWLSRANIIYVNVQCSLIYRSPYIAFRACNHSHGSISPATSYTVNLVTALTLHVMAEKMSYNMSKTHTYTWWHTNNKKKKK